MSKIVVENVSKSYLSNEQTKQKLLVLDDLSLKIDDGEFVTFFGPNGCGKTTFLKTIAGIESIDSGSIFIDSKKPSEAQTGFVFQNYSDSLMYWLNCRDNILFAYQLNRRKHTIDDANDRLESWLSDLNINLPLNNYPYQLSGGQQQLVSILRTLIYQPDVILMDEPFSSLDYKTRSFMYEALLTLWERERPTILFISHDIEEAIYLADRVVLLNPLPTSIKKIHSIQFKRPRTRDLFDNEAFFHLKRELLQNAYASVI